MFKDIDPKLVNILEQLVQVNPYFRLSANECLKDPLFDDIRSAQLEKSCNVKLLLEVDQEGAFDYNEGKSMKFTI